MMYLLTFVAIFIGGLVQTTVGFGGGLFRTLILSTMIAIPAANTLSTASTVLISATMGLKYRKHTHIKTLIVPMITYFIVFELTIGLVARINAGALKASFGLALVAMGIYSMFFTDKIKINGGWLSGIICGGLTGVLSAFFGIGGPPYYGHLPAGHLPRR